MSASSYAQPQGSLLFHWERPRRRKLAILGFIGGVVRLARALLLSFSGDLSAGDFAPPAAGTGERDRTDFGGSAHVS